MFKEFIKPIITGAAVGVAMVIPGVSGGSMAVILGEYDRLISSVNSSVWGWNHAKSCLNAWRYLVFVAIGGAISIWLSAFAIGWVLASYPSITLACFAGLILGSVPKDLQSIRGLALYLKIPFIIVPIVLLHLLHTMSFSSTWVSSFGEWGALAISGAIAAAAMVVPGISGSLLLLLIGTYDTVLGAIRAGDFVLIGIFALGAIIGGLAATRGIQHVLRNYPRMTRSVIVGLLIGSVWVLWLESRPYGIDEMISFWLLAIGTWYARKRFA